MKHIWLVYTQGYCNNCLYDFTGDSCSTNIVIPISIRLDHTSLQVEVGSLSSIVLSPTTFFSDFKDAERWNTLEDVLNTVGQEYPVG